MSLELVEALQQYLGRLCDEAVPPGDGVLLKRFVEANDRDAFEMLIARHGPMVLGTARRLVDEAHDAEDVFQAVFLSLARLAKSIRQGSTLPAWLHRATSRIAAKVRAKRPARWEPPNEPIENGDPGARLHWQEIRQGLDEELERLPERLRSPLLLCYVTGLARDEAARQLGWSLAMLKRRLEQGRRILRTRLEARGIAAAGLVVAVLTPKAMQAAVSTSLLDGTLGMVFSKEAHAPESVSVLILQSAATMKGVVMKSIFAILAVVGIGVGVWAGMGQADPPAKATDQKEDAKPVAEEKVANIDDPLPAGSVLRFGTSRFRYGVSMHNMTVSPDGKTAFVTNDSHPPRAFDLASGRVLFSLNYGSVEAGVYSPDGRALVLKQNFDLCVFDAESGKQLRTIKGEQKNLRHSGVPVFTPDGKAIATISDGKDVHLFDFESGNTIRDFVHDIPKSGAPSDFAQVIAIAFSADGKLMATGGYGNEKGNYFARLWDVETGKELRRFPHGPKGYGIGSLTFSPDGKTLATLGTQGDVFLRLFDVETGKEQRAFPTDGELRPSPGSVVFSPDGKTVAAALNSIHLYDTTTGEERLRIDHRASILHFTDDGKTLTAGVSGAIYRWETATGKMLTPEAADSAVDRILVSPDGSRVITRGQNSDGYIWDGASGKLLRRIPVAYDSGLAISPDGRFLAWPVADYKVQFKDPQESGSTFYGTRIRLYDLAAHKLVDRFPAFKGSAQDLAFTHDGRKIVTVEKHGGLVRIWDFAAGKEERSFPILSDTLKKKSYIIGRTMLSPDGKTVVVTYVDNSNPGRLGLRRPPQHDQLWDVATGRELPHLNGGHPIDGAFSPDGRLVVTRGEIHVCEVATGKRLATLPADYIEGAAFSRDGRYLATIASRDAVHIWEVATWTRLKVLKGHRDRPTALAFTPGGQLLSGSVDTTVLAWDLRPPQPSGKVTLDSAWSDLAKYECAEAFKAEGAFLAKAPEAIRFFAAKVKPEAPVDAKRVQQLIGDLDSDQFAEREAASKALSALGRQVIPWLEDTVKTAKSTEVQDRAKKLVEGLKDARATTDQLRQMRALLVLELIDDDESRSLLARWASGPAGALLTTEASAALIRLAVKSKR